MAGNLGLVRRVKRGPEPRVPLLWLRLAACLALLALSAAMACGAVFPAGRAAAQEASPAAGATPTGDAVAMAKQRVEQATAHVTTWDGPTTGPSAQAGKSIVYVSTDQRNGGAAGVGKGVEEAAKAIGWKLTTIDGQGTVTGQSAALSQAIALKPDGIVLGGVDGTAMKTLVAQAADQGIEVVGWHAAAAPGPQPDLHLFTNIQSNPVDTATITADYVIAQTDGQAQVAILTDSQYQIAIEKSTAMRDEIERCPGCAVLSYDDTPLAEVSTRMAPLTTSYLQRFGDKLNWILGINDLYFDFAVPALTAAGIPPSGPPQFVSAGDGSVSAYERVRAGQYQAATIPEPLNLHGWQAVDELNRAFAGNDASGYVTPVHLVTKENIEFDGGPQNVFDPDNGYRDAYKKIWGVS
jgi:ribose transport system substrate-binding protein